jgi:hypothetical protein
MPSWTCKRCDQQFELPVGSVPAFCPTCGKRPGSTPPSTVGKEYSVGWLALSASLLLGAGAVVAWFSFLASDIPRDSVKVQGLGAIGATGCGVMVLLAATNWMLYKLTNDTHAIRISIEEGK